MVAAITLGTTLQRARERGLVRSADEERMWVALAADIRKIRALGGMPDPPVEV